MNPRRPAALLAAVLALATGSPIVRADDPPPAAPKDPVKEQLFADKEAERALELIRQGGIVEVMEGLDKLSKVTSEKVTTDVVQMALARRELHVAEFAGYALAKADPTGAMDVIEKRMTAGNGLDTPGLIQAAGMLSELPPPRSVTLLTSDTLLHNHTTEVRREAIRALAWHKSPEVVSTALDALGSKDAGLRNVACVALGRVGDPRAVAALLGKLDESDGGTGGFAAVALGRIESDDIFPHIVARIGKGDRMTKGKALVAAARPQHVDRLENMVKSGSEDSKIAACAALAKVGKAPLAVQETVLQTMLGDSSRWVRAAAFHALGQIATNELGPALAGRMGQRDEEKQTYVYEIAGRIRAKECVEDVEKAMWSEKHPIVSRVATVAFWRIADPDAIVRAEERIRKATGKNFGRATIVLGLRRNRNGFDLALELLDRITDGRKEEFWVELALEKQTGHFFGNDSAVWREWIEANPKFFEKEQAKVEREKWREDFLKENTGPRVTPATEIAVQRALDFLARHQSPSGAFDQQEFLSLCEKDDPCPTGAGARIQMVPVGTSGLCTLAFFGAGYGPAEGRYRGVVWRSMEWMLAQQQPDGDYSPNDLIGGYNRPIALQTYAEARMATGDDEYLPYIQRGVDFIACIQADKGGWRYRVVDNANDSSVVAWVLFAAKAAEKAHAVVSPSIYLGCDLVLTGYQVRPIEEREDFYRDIDPNYAFEVGHDTTYEFHTGYQDAAYQANAMTALGLMSRILLGYRRSHPFCIGSANKILSSQMPQVPKDQNWQKLNINAQYPMYFMYYGTLAMHQMGGRYFRVWNEAVKQILPGTQETKGCQRGSWDGKGLDGLFSRLYTTSMGALTLETYYRYAPVLQD